MLLIPDNKTKINVLRANIAGPEPDPAALKEAQDKKGKGDDKKKTEEDEG